MPTRSCFLAGGLLLGLLVSAIMLHPRNCRATNGNQSSTDSGQVVIKLELTSGTRVYRRLEPILISYKLINGSKVEYVGVRVTTPEFRSLDLRVTRDGVESPRTLHFKTSPSVARGNYRVLHPGSALHGRLVVNSLYDMTADGDYSIEVCISWNQVSGENVPRKSGTASARIRVSVVGDAEIPGA